MYIPLSKDELKNIKEKHTVEKQKLFDLEMSVHYRLYNPELSEQRDVVRKLKDTIIADEGWYEYKKFAKKKCMFQVNEECLKKINHTFHNYLTYGNCCQNCSRTINRRTTLSYGEYDIITLLTPYTKIWEELSDLDDKEN